MAREFSSPEAEERAIRLAEEELEKHNDFDSADLDWEECGYCGTRGTIQSDTTIDVLTGEYAVFRCWYCERY